MVSDKQQVAPVIDAKDLEAAVTAVTATIDDPNQQRLFMQEKTRYFERLFSIQVLLPLLVVIQLLVVVLVIWGISFANTQSAVNSLSKDLQSKSADLVSAFSRELLSSAPICTLIMLGEFQVDNLNLMQPAEQKSMRTIYSQQRAFINAYGIYFGTREGRYGGYQKNPDGSFLAYVISNTTNYFTESYNVNMESGELLDMFDFSSPYDCRTRPWYILAEEKKRAVWTEPYVFVANPGYPIEVGITAARPFYDVNGTLLAIAAVDYSASGLGAFLASLKVSKHGRAFIVQGEGFTVAESKATTGVSDMYLLVDSADRLVSGAAKEMQRRFKGYKFEDIYPTGTNRISIQIKADNRKCFLVLTKFDSIGEDIKWTIGIIVPTNDVLGSIYRNMGISFGVIGIFVVCALVIALIGSLILARPLSKLSQQMYQVSRMELTGVEQARLSTLYEVRSIQRSFFKMVFALHSFRKYVPDVVIKKSLANSQVAELHMTSEYLTLFFLDIEDFTVLSERMRPDELVIIIGEGLEGTSDIVTRRGGCVDKYIGDCIMALFNVPDRNSQHEAFACLAALECIEFLERKREEWISRDLPALKCRIGIHSGTALVGNFGSTTRMNFTAIGDTVNLAARLEPLNKFYKSHILISGQTYESAKGTIVAKLADVVQVKGRTEETALYHLLGARATATPEQLEMESVMQEYLHGIQSGNLAAAHNSLCVAQTIPGFETDHSLNVLEARVNFFIKNPDRFDPVYKFTEKEF